MNIFSADTNTADLTEAVKRDGYAIVEKLIDASQIARLKSELEPHVEVTEKGTEDFWGYETKRFGALIRKSEMAREMLVHPTVLGVADDILLQFCARYWVNYTGIMHLGPGEKAQLLHRDTNLWPIRNPAPPLTLATMWAVSDFTAENGATALVPGSHLWEDARTPEPHEIIPAVMPAGSVLIYSGNVVHGGGANQSMRPRFGVALHYVLGWLRQEETQLLTMSMDEARALPEQVQRLMGYSLGANSLGFVDHTDPFDYLNGKQGDGPGTLGDADLAEAEKRVQRLRVVATETGERSRFAAKPE